MTELELQTKILDFFKTHYNACYIGYLEVIRNDTFYTFKIGIPSYMYPTVIQGDFNNDDDFLEFIYDEMKIRNYMRIYFYKTQREAISTNDQLQ